MRRARGRGMRAEINQLIACQSHGPLPKPLVLRLIRQPVTGKGELAFVAAIFALKHHAAYGRRIARIQGAVDNDIGHRSPAGKRLGACFKINCLRQTALRLKQRFLLGVHSRAAQQAFHAPAIGYMGQRPVGFGNEPAGHAAVRARAEIARKLAGNCGQHEKTGTSYSQLAAQTKGFI